MKNITVFISSFLRRGHRWQLAALVALFFVAGCTVELYPPAQEVNNLPDGGKVDVLPDTIPRAFAFGPRIYWSQIIASDSSYSIAVTDANNKGRWLDSLRWVPSGPYVTVNGDTLATRAYARDNSALTGDNQVLIYNGSGSLTIENGNTVDMSDLLDNTDAQTIDTLALQGDTMLQVSLSGDGAPVKELDLSALRSVVDSTRLAQDSILVYYQDGIEVGRDTISGTGGGGGSADNLGNHTMTQNLQTNGNWISGDGGNEGIGVDADGKIGVGTTTPLYIIDINSTDAVKLPVGTTSQRPTGADGLLRYNSDLTRFEGYYNAEWNGLGSTLADVSAMSTTTAKSLYTMTSGQNVEFRRSGGSSLLYLDETNETVGIGTNAPIDLLTIQQPSSNVNDSRNGLWIKTDAYNGVGQVLRMSNISGSYWMTIGGFHGAYLAFNTNINYEFKRNGTTLYTVGTNTIDGGASYQTLSLRPTSGGLGGLKIQGRSGQTADMFIIEDNAYNDLFTIKSNGKIGIKNDSPTAFIHLPAGTAAANTAPLKFTSGINLTTPEAGAMEWDGTNLYITQTTGPTRKTIAYVDTDDGSASDTTDGSGDITVSHTLGSASITVTATATGTTFYHVQVHTKTSTTFKIRFFDAAGAAVTATAVTADWIAKLQ